MTLVCSKRAKQAYHCLIPRVRVGYALARLRDWQFASSIGARECTRSDFACVASRKRRQFISEQFALFIGLCDSADLCSDLEVPSDDGTSSWSVFRAFTVGNGGDAKEHAIAFALLRFVSPCLRGASCFDLLIRTETSLLGAGPANLP